MCLEDPDGAVRAAAFVSLRDRVESVIPYSHHILRACDYGTIVARPTEDRAEKIGLENLALARASCPVLASLAIQDPKLVVQCLSRIIKAAALCAENDTLQEPIEALDAMHKILVEIPYDQLVAYLLSDPGLRLLRKARQWSPEWRSLTSKLEGQKLLTEAPQTEEYRRTLDANDIAIAVPLSALDDSVCDFSSACHF